jgi:hypothetical protein
MSQASLLVLIHGALMDRRSMLALTPMLRNQHAVLCPDLADHGLKRPISFLDLLESTSSRSVPYTEIKIHGGSMVLRNELESSHPWLLLLTLQTGSQNLLS